MNVTLGYDLSGRRITMLRDLRGLTLEQVAASVGLRAFVLRRLESQQWARVSPEVAHGLALRLRCRVSTLEFEPEHIDDGNRWSTLHIPGGRGALCRRPADALCDHPEDGGTCDARLCDVHAQQVGPDAHRCPEHSDDRAEEAVGERMARRMCQMQRGARSCATFVLHGAGMAKRERRQVPWPSTRGPRELVVGVQRHADRPG